MSTCVHTNKPLYQYMDVSKPGEMLVIDSDKLPENPAVGTMYFNAQTNQVMIWTGNDWTPVDRAGPEEDILKEWEITTDNEGFVNIRIFEDLDGKRRITVSTYEGKIIKQDLENVLEYIKNNTSKKQYLWNEARIFEYFS